MMAKPLGRPGRDGKGKRPSFGAKPGPAGKKPGLDAKRGTGGKRIGFGGKRGSPGRRSTRDDASEVRDEDESEVRDEDESEVRDQDASDEHPAQKGRAPRGRTADRKGKPTASKGSASKGGRVPGIKAPSPARGAKPVAEPLTFRSQKNKQVDPKRAIELAPFTGAVRESQVIRVQPMARAAKGSQEILFGRIARDCGFINQKALDRCIQAQKEDSTGGRKFLGDILVDEELLTRMEVDEILKIQHRNLQKRYKYSGEKQEQALFGRLIVKKEFATKEQVNECIRWQAEMERFNEKVPLGELLIAKGYAQDADVESVLRLQAKGRAKREALDASGEHPVEAPSSARPSSGANAKSDTAAERTSKRTKPAPSREGEPGPEREATKPKPDLSTKGHGESASGVRALASGEGSSSGVRAAPTDAERTRALESSSTLEALGGDAKRAAPQAVVKGWYLGLLGRAYGPLPRRLIDTLFESSALGPDDLFWHQDLDGWHTARSIEEFPAPLPVGSTFSSAGGPPLPLQAKSPKALAESFDALRDRGVLEDADHLRLRKLLTQPFAS